MDKNTEDFWEQMETLRIDMINAANEYDKECESFWSGLSYENKLKAFYAVTKRIHQGNIVEGRSYRGVLYGIFGFDVDAYTIGMESGYMEIHNSIPFPEKRVDNENE